MNCRHKNTATIALEREKDGKHIAYKTCLKCHKRTALAASEDRQQAIKQAIKAWKERK